MYGPIEDSYFIWLSNQVDYAEVPTPSLTHNRLLRLLHATEFVWTVSGDDNRAAKGYELRGEFLDETQSVGEPHFDSAGTSVLEMLIALAYDIEFQMDECMSDWFWVMLGNLGIADITDADDYDLNEVVDILDAFVWRQYESDGAGGLFPLSKISRDETRVEIWYQFHAYLEDNDL